MYIINLLKTSKSEFRKITSDLKYAKLIQKKLKILIDTSSLELANISSYFLVDNNGEGDYEAQIEELVNEIKSDWVEIKTSSSIFQFKKSDVSNHLKKLKPGEAVVIRDFVKTDYCGYAWITKSENVYIEAIKGGFYGYWERAIYPTHYIVNKKSEILKEDIKSTKEFYTYDYENVEWVCQTLDTSEKVMLSHRYIDEIVKVVLSVNPNSRSRKVVWILNDDQLTIFDVFMPVGAGVIE